LVTGILSLLGYGMVLGTLYSDTLSFIYPDIGLRTVNLLSHVIALNNTLTVGILILGWYFIQNGSPRLHGTAMSVAFLLILVFLVLYLLKTGGGGRKEFVGPLVVKIPYLIMLLVHILLSIVSVPLVLYSLILALGRPLTKVGESVHPAVGPWAAGCWIVSLSLGILCYLLLHHAYTFEYVPA